jgi:hypothetical protein
LANSAGQTPPQQKAAFDLTSISSAGRGLPARIILHGVEAIGKTSWAAQADRPLFAMVRGETGIETLIDAGQVKAVAHTPEIERWTDLLNLVDTLRTEKHNYGTLVIDSMTTAERVCHEYVCAQHYGNDWSERGFLGYMRGYDTSVSEWLKLLNGLDQLRRERKVRPIIIGHTKIATFKNPEGADYDRYVVDVHHKTWSQTLKWSDMVLFANYYTVVDEQATSTKNKGKGKGGTERIIYTQRTAAWDAKNRHGLPEEISMGESAAEGWQHFLDAITTARNGE